MIFRTNNNLHIAFYNYFNFSKQEHPFKKIQKMNYIMNYIMKKILFLVN